MLAWRGLINLYFFHNSLFKAKKLPRETVLKLGEQLLTIMYGVHSRGIVHRDINPSNIIALFDQHGHPSAALIDFGMAISRKSESLAPITFPSDYAFCASAAHDGKIDWHARTSRSFS